MVVIQQTKLVQSVDEKFGTPAKHVNNNGIATEEKLSFVMNVENDQGCEFYLSTDNTLIRLEDSPQVEPLIIECTSISDLLRQLRGICPASYSIYALERSEFTSRQKQLRIDSPIN